MKKAYAMKIIICLFLLTGCSYNVTHDIKWKGFHGASGVAYLESQEEAKRDKG